MAVSCDCDMQLVEYIMELYAIFCNLSTQKNADTF